VSHLQNVVDRDTQEANEALAVYEATKVRYDLQVILLEALQSQLHAARKTADSLTRHTLSLEEELEELRGLIHPIRRCPDDVMQNIFELVTIPDIGGEHGEWTWEDGPIQLSHVCQRWRDLALSTPRIWSCVSFEITDRSCARKSMVAAFVRRVKHIPAKITFSLQFDEVDMDRAAMIVKKIPFQQLYHVPNISAINFLIGGETVRPSRILDAVNGFPKKPFDSLTINLDSDDHAVSMDQFISRFHPFRKLVIVGITFGPLTTSKLDESLVKLEELDLYSVSNVSLLELFWKAPKLQILRVNCHDMVPLPDATTSSYTLPNLRSIEVGGGEFPWAQIICPNLIRLSVAEIGDEPENVWEFISRTKSITEVMLRAVKSEDLARLARSAAQLERLQLTKITDSLIMSVLVNWRDIGLEDPPFPQLYALTLREPCRELRPTTLDSLIQARCLAVGHPESTMDGINRVLNEFLIESRFCDGTEKWLNSRFLGTHFSRSGDDAAKIVYLPDVGVSVIRLAKFCYTLVGNSGKA
jgi:hypothetical protein